MSFNPLETCSKEEEEEEAVKNRGLRLGNRANFHRNLDKAAVLLNGVYFTDVPFYDAAYYCRYLFMLLGAFEVLFDSATAQDEYFNW